MFALVARAEERCRTVHRDRRHSRTIQNRKQAVHRRDEAGGDYSLRILGPVCKVRTVRLCSRYSRNGECHNKESHHAQELDSDTVGSFDYRHSCREEPFSEQRRRTGTTNNV